MVLGLFWELKRLVWPSPLEARERVKYAHGTSVDGTVWWSGKMLYPMEKGGWKATSGRHLTLIEECGSGGGGGSSAMFGSSLRLLPQRFPMLALLLFIFLLNHFNWTPAFKEETMNVGGAGTFGQGEGTAGGGDPVGTAGGSF